MSEFLSCADLKTRMEAQDAVLLLDCRSNDDYHRGHLVSSHNIVLPQLMMRRLKAGKLSLKALVPPNSRQSKDAFLHKCTTHTVVLYDSQAADSHQQQDSLKSLLYKRMQQEGCSVLLLKGGYSDFAAHHPDYCLKTGSNPGSDADDEGCASDDSAVATSPGGRCSPTSPLRIIAPPVLGLGSLRIACVQQDDDSDCCDSVNAHKTRGRIPTCPSCCQLQLRRQNHGGSHDDGFNSDEESDSNNAKTAPALVCSCQHRQLQTARSTPNSLGQRNSYTSSAAPAEILPGLFLGCAKDAASEDVLSAHGITYILNVTPNLPNVFAHDPRYKYKQIPIIDHWNQNLSQFFPEAIQFIDEARTQGCGVLVHCLAGISRSVTLTVAYLMQTRKWSLNCAYDFVKLRKSDVSPNFNFMGQLLDFEKQLGIVTEDDQLDSASGGSPSSSSSSSTGSCGSGGAAPTLFFTTPPTPAPLTPGGAVPAAFILPTPLA